MDFYFYSLEPRRIRKAILKRNDYGFVIGYYLMLDEYYKNLQVDNSKYSFSLFLLIYSVNDGVMKSDIF